jgi:hypothetical protein
MDPQGRQLGSEEAKAIVRRRFGELDLGNIGILDELFSPHYKLNFPGRDPLGLQETKRFYKQMYLAFSDLRHEIQEQIAEGNKVVTRWTATGDIPANSWESNQRTIPCRSRELTSTRLTATSWWRAM